MTEGRNTDWVARADALRLVHRNAEAERVARQGLAGDPDNVSGLNVLALAVLEQNRPMEALEIVDRLAALRPDASWVFTLRSAVLVELKRPREAVQAALEGVKRAPDSSSAHDGAAIAYYRARSLPKAREHAERARALDPENNAVVLHLALISAGQGVRGEAMDLYREVLARDPGNAAALNNLGLLHRKNGEHRQAVQLFEQAARTQPTMDSATVNLAYEAREQTSLLGSGAGARRAERWIEWILAYVSLRLLIANQLVAAALIIVVWGALLVTQSLVRRWRERRLEGLLKAAREADRWRGSWLWGRPTERSGVPRPWRVAIALLVAGDVAYSRWDSHHSHGSTIVTAVLAGLLALYWVRLVAGYLMLGRRALARRGWWPAAR